MHFNFHLSGDESPEQSRRIANAVLALGGLTSATFESAPTVSAEDRAFLDEIMDRSEARFGAAVSDAPLAESVSALVELAGAGYVSEVSNVVPSTDKAGLPWDERIHSSSRAINADGTWRYRKNVPDETKREVEAELKGLVTGAIAGKGSYVITSVGIVDEHVLNDPNTVVSPPAPPLPPTPPTPPTPPGALQRTYSDVVNLIMSRKVQPDTYVAILGMSLPEFAKHVISAPNDATLMFDALDAASRP